MLSCLLPLRAMAASFDGLYVFGDSLSDDGNLYKATGDSTPENPPYYQGRFSNGPVWVEYLATDLGLTFNPNTDFAYGGAGSGYNSTSVNPNIPGLLTQVDGFTSYLQQTHQQADPNALYTVWAGSNDYVFGNVTDPSRPVDNILSAITSLAQAGAKNFLVPNLPDLGSVPLVNQNSQVSNELATLSSLHNSDLASGLDTLSEKLSPDSVNIFQLDVNSLFNDALANPGKYGFTNVTDSCLSPLGAPVMVPATPCATDQQAQNKYLFWDGEHPTTAAQWLIAEDALSVIDDPPPVPEPSEQLGMLAFSILGIAYLYKRKQNQR